MPLIPNTKFLTVFLIAGIFLVLGMAASVKMIIENQTIKRTEQQISRNFARFKAYEVPEKLPALRFAGPDGEEVILKDYRGNLLVMNVWATWCRPCITELPSLERLQNMTRGQNIKVIAVSVDLRKDIDKIGEFLDQHEIGAVARYHDIHGDLQDKLNPRALPATYILDGRGRVLYEIAGEADWSSPKIAGFLQKLAAR